MYAPYLISFSYRVPRSPTTIMFSAKRTYSFFQHLVLSVNSDHLSEGLDADDTTPRHTSHYATPHHTMPRLQRRRRLWRDKDSHPLPLHPQLQPLNHLVHTNCHENTHINLASFVLSFLSSDPFPHKQQVCRPTCSRMMQCSCFLASLTMTQRRYHRCIITTAM